MRYRQGKFKPINPQKYVGNVSNIIYRSSYELKFFIFCDNEPNIIQWNSEEFIVKYISPIDKREHRYFLDAWIKYKDKTGKEHIELIEIKPFSQTIEPKKPKNKRQRDKAFNNYMKQVETWLINNAKWKAATQISQP